MKADDSRLRGVHGRGGVTDVLRALKHPEGQTAQEVSGRQQPGNWAQLETSSLWERHKHTDAAHSRQKNISHVIFKAAKSQTCKLFLGIPRKGSSLLHPQLSSLKVCTFSATFRACVNSLNVTFQEGGDLSELRDAVLSVATLLLQLLQTVHELPAGQTRVNTAQLPVHLPPFNTTTLHQGSVITLCCAAPEGSFSPCGHFFCCVLHGGQRVAPVTQRVCLNKSRGFMRSDQLVIKVCDSLFVSEGQLRDESPSLSVF